MRGAPPVQGGFQILGTGNVSVIMPDTSVHRQSGGYCRYAAETGRRFPCHGAVADSLGLVQQTTEIPQLQYIDGVFDVLVAQVQQICAKLWEMVEIPQLQLVSPGQVVARPLCATTSAHGR